MRTGLWLLFIGSFSVLALILLRNRYAMHFVARLGLGVVLASLFIYGFNWLAAPYSVSIPFNAVTVGVVGILGIPGLALLAGIKLFVV